MDAKDSLKKNMAEIYARQTGLFELHTKAKTILSVYLTGRRIGSIALRGLARTLLLRRRAGIRRKWGPAHTIIRLSKSFAFLFSSSPFVYSLFPLFFSFISLSPFSRLLACSFPSIQGSPLDFL